MSPFETETEPVAPLTFDQVVRANPLPSILAALGAGFVIAVAVRALQPRPVENRAARLLEDLSDRLMAQAHPMLKRAGGVASDGADFIQDRADDFSKLQLGKRLKSLVCDLRERIGR